MLIWYVICILFCSLPVFMATFLYNVVITIEVWALKKPCDIFHCKPLAQPVFHPVWCGHPFLLFIHLTICSPLFINTPWLLSPCHCHWPPMFVVTRCTSWMTPAVPGLNATDPVAAALPMSSPQTSLTPRATSSLSGKTLGDIFTVSLSVFNVFFLLLSLT